MSIQPQQTPPTTTTAPSTSSIAAAPPSEATTKLAEAIDDFLSDVEKKFKNISDEILSKLDDMSERCDRLEQEMLVRDSAGIDTRSKSTLVGGESGGDGSTSY